MFTNRLYVIFILIFSSFALADVVYQMPVLDPHHPNKLVNGVTVTRDSSGRLSGISVSNGNKSTFNNASSSGNSISAGRPINATVNNGYGDSGKIVTQAASKYGKIGAIRAAANKSVGPISNAVIVYQLSNWTGTQLKNLYDCVSYQECHPEGKPLPVPPNAPPPPSVPFTPPTGGEYDPTKKNLIVIEANGSPAMVFSSDSGISLSSPGQTGQPSKVDANINIPGFGNLSLPKGTYWGGYTIYNVKPEDVKKYEGMFYKDLHPEAYVPPVTAEDLYNALIWNMEHMPQEVATAIMNALHDGGYLGAPDSTVFDPASYISPPYTAADTGIAQQDKFTLNQDGSISHQVVTRPDLQGNNQLAPEKQPLTNPTNPTEPEKPTEPEEEVIPPIDDVVIPTEESPIAFTPDNTFQSDGVCPAPTVLNVMGASFDISYEPFCYTAEKIRPFLILISAFSSLYFCLSVAFKG